MLTDILWLFTFLVAQQTTSSTPTATTNYPTTNPTTHGKSNNTGVKPMLKQSFLYKTPNTAVNTCRFNLDGINAGRDKIVDVEKVWVIKFYSPWLLNIVSSNKL